MSPCNDKGKDRILSYPSPCRYRVTYNSISYPSPRCYRVTYNSISYPSPRCYRLTYNIILYPSPYRYRVTYNSISYYYTPVSEQTTNTESVSGMQYSCRSRPPLTWREKFECCPVNSPRREVENCGSRPSGRI